MSAKHDPAAAAKLAERWEAAVERARSKRIVVRPSRLPGRWVAAYRDHERGTVRHAVVQTGPGPVAADRLACDCAAGAAGDPICMHRAAVMLWLGYPTGFPTAELMERSAAARGSRPPCPGCGAGAPYVDCDCAAPPAEPRPRVRRWTNVPAAKPKPEPAARDLIEEARQHMGYLLHREALSSAAADSVKRALLALNRAYTRA